MASSVVSPASHEESCPLLKLPPELRLKIYHYAHQLRLDNNDDPDGSSEALNQSWTSSWGSAPLVQFAATCRLVANGIRPTVRSLPTSKRVAHLDFSGTYLEYPMQLRLRHLPCPLIDLRHIAVMYDFESPTDSSAITGLDAAVTVHEAMRDLTFSFHLTLRTLMVHEALDKATELKGFQFRLSGLQRNGCEESYTQDLRRILDLEKPDPGSAQDLARRIRKFYQSWRGTARDEATLRLATINGRSLHLLV